MTEENYVNLVIEKGVQKMMARIKAGRAFIGKNPGRELISPEKQLEAYLELTPEDKMSLLQQKGPEAFAEYVMANEARLRKREGNGIKNTS